MSLKLIIEANTESGSLMPRRFLFLLLAGTPSRERSFSMFVSVVWFMKVTASRLDINWSLWSSSFSFLDSESWRESSSFSPNIVIAS